MRILDERREALVERERALLLRFTEFLTSFGSPAIIGLLDCSNGSMMFKPIEFSRPAPTWPASTGSRPSAPLRATLSARPNRAPP